MRMEFGIEKYAMLIMKSWKREITKGRELRKLDTIRTLRKLDNSKNLAILETDTIKQAVIKEKKKRKKKHIGRKLKVTETKIHSKNLIWSSSLRNIFWTIIQMEKGETQINGPEKLMTMYIREITSRDSMY